MRSINDWKRIKNIFQVDIIANVKIVIWHNDENKILFSEPFSMV